jgi:hypothetical protein
MGRCGEISSTPADVAFATNQSLIPGLVNVRQAYIHGVSSQCTVGVVTADIANPVACGWGVVPNGSTLIAPAIPTGQGNADLIINTNPRKRYQIQFALGLFNQPKLIPTKFMASQLAIEITLANPSECIYTPVFSGTALPTPTYQVTNVNLVPEILEFDASYGYEKLM